MPSSIAGATEHTGRARARQPRGGAFVGATWDLGAGRPDHSSGLSLGFRVHFVDFASAHDRASLPALKGKYDVVNIKLDKTGGLTEALALRQQALAKGFAIMVGCMVGSSLAMAPAVLVAQGAAITDLDGPLLLAEDRQKPLLFDVEGVHPADPALWG